LLTIHLLLAFLLGLAPLALLLPLLLDALLLRLRVLLILLFLP
jgi:hypothetical protein